MSNHTRYYTDAKDRISNEILKINGPTIPIFISVPDALANELGKSGIVAKPQSGLALIDTGASSSMVDETIIKSLNLNPIRKGSVITPGGISLMNFYPAKFSFPGTDLPDLDFTSVLSSEHLGKTKNIVALIGRDILRHGVLVYNGDGHICLGLNPNKSISKGTISPDQ